MSSTAICFDFRLCRAESFRASDILALARAG
jgi:hypothetical protein